MDEPSSPTQSTILLLRSLQEIRHNRIIQKKAEIHGSHNRLYNDNLWREIETLQRLSLNTHAAATITSRIKSLALYPGSSYDVKSDLHPFGLFIMSNLF